MKDEEILPVQSFLLSSIVSPLFSSLSLFSSMLSSPVFYELYQQASANNSLNMFSNKEITFSHSLGLAMSSISSSSISSLGLWVVLAAGRDNLDPSVKKFNG